MGHAMAGKTSLNRRLSDEGADAELPAETDRTIGVDLGRLVIPWREVHVTLGTSSALKMALGACTVFCFFLAGAPAGHHVTVA